MRFVPAQKTDEATLLLSPAKWLVAFVLIDNAMGRESFICHDRIHKIPSPARHAAYLLTPGQTLYFSIPPSNGGRFGGHLTPTPQRHLLT